MGLINLDNLGSKGTPTKSNVPMNMMAAKNNNQSELIFLSTNIFILRADASIS